MVLAKLWKVFVVMVDQRRMRITFFHGGAIGIPVPREAFVNSIFNTGFVTAPYKFCHVFYPFTFYKFQVFQGYVTQFVTNDANILLIVVKTTLIFTCDGIFTETLI